MKTCIYLIKAITNMHVGNGEISYSVIDNLVQKDAITDYPTINSSGVKGALREHMKSTEEFAGGVNYAFGDENAPGNFSFFAANLLSIPVRSNKKQFFRAVSTDTLKAFSEYYEMFTNEDMSKLNGVIENLEKIKDENKAVIFEEISNCIIEDYEAVHKKCDGLEYLIKLVGANIALLPEKYFKRIATKLPVMARNSLENGKSVNLWYEEIVPRETIFYTAIGYGKEYGESFESILLEDVVQIGANASIGYGYSKFNKFEI